LYPEWTDAKLQLLEQYLFVGNYAKSLAFTQEFKKIGSAQASRLFRAVAYSEAMSNAQPQAEVSAKRATEFARTEFDKAECKRLADFLNLQKQGSQVSLRDRMRELRQRADQEDAIGFGDTAEDEATSTQPYLRRSELAAVETAPGRESIMRVTDSVKLEAVLTHIECGGAFPILRLETAEGTTLELDLRDPSKINLEVLQPGESLKPRELNCGDRKRKVRLSYGKPTADQTRGQLRTIQYVH